MSTKMCRRVVAGPHATNKHISKSALNIFWDLIKIFAGVSRMLLVPGLQTSNPLRTTDGYILAASGNFLVLQKLPLTGAPRSVT